MRSTRSLAAALVAASLGLGSGCATPPQRSTFTALTTKGVPPVGAPLDELPRTRNVEVTVVSHLIGWVPTRSTPPTLEEAVDRALAKGGGDMLVDVLVDRWAWYIPFVYGQEGWRVLGDVVRIESE